jgi:hypothetical protein
MVEVPPTFDAAWFVEHQSFHNDSENVLSLTSVDVNIEDINNVFGPRLNKNGWKYDNRPNAKTVKLIKKIYCLVTRKNKICNKQLTMLFARAIVAESKGKHVNWATFGVHLMNQKSIVKNVKQEATRVKANKIGATSSKK